MHEIMPTGPTAAPSVLQGPICTQVYSFILKINILPFNNTLKVVYKDSHRHKNEGNKPILGKGDLGPLEDRTSHHDPDLHSIHSFVHSMSTGILLML